MATEKDKRRLSLFKTFAKSFEFVRSSIEKTHMFIYRNEIYRDEIIACPICLQFRTIHALDQETENPLTIEHVPPESLGGKGLVLTCWNCNNGSASTLDSKLLEYTKVKDFYSLKLESKIESNIRHDGKPLVRGEVIIGKDNINYVKLIQNPNDSRNLNFKEILKKGIEVTFKASPERQAQIAELRIAYLLVFSRIGFPYIFNPNLDKIRQQILFPDKNIIPDLSIIRNMDEDNIDGVSIIKEPAALRSLCAGFHTILDRKKHFTRVNLPLPKQEAGEFYNRLVSFQGQGLNVQVAQLTSETDFLTIDANVANLFAMLEFYDNPIGRDS